MLRRRPDSLNTSPVPKAQRSKSVTHINNYKDSIKFIQQEPADFFGKKKYSNFTFNPNFLEKNAIIRAAIEKASPSPRVRDLTPVRGTFRTSYANCYSKDSSPVVSLRNSFQMSVSEVNSDLSVYKAMKRDRENFLLDKEHSEYMGHNRRKGRSEPRKPVQQLLLGDLLKKEPRSPRKSPSKELDFNYEPTPLPSLRVTVANEVKNTFQAVLKSQEHGDIGNLQMMKEVTPQFNKKVFKPLNIFKNEPIKEDSEAKATAEIYNKAVDRVLDRIALYNRCYSTYLLMPPLDSFSRKQLGLNSGPLGAKIFKQKKIKADVMIKIDAINTIAAARNKRLKENDTKPKIKEIPRPDPRTLPMSKVSPQIIEENEHKFEQTMIKLEQVDKLLEQKGKPMNELEQEFMKAVKEGNILLSLEILNKNPSLVNLRDQSNQTPLHWAVKRKYERIVKSLLRHGADIHALDFVGRTPKDIALKSENREIIALLKAYDGGYFYEKTQESDEAHLDA